MKFKNRHDAVVLLTSILMSLIATSAAAQGPESEDDDQSGRTLLAVAKDHEQATQTDASSSSAGQPEDADSASPAASDRDARTSADRQVAENAAVLEVFQDSGFGSESDSNGADIAAVDEMDASSSDDNKLGLGVYGAGRSGGEQVDEAGLDIANPETKNADQAEKSCKPYPECADADLGHHSDRNRLQAVLKNHRGEVESCFARHLGSKASGWAVVRVRISGKGKVAETSVNSSATDDEAVDRCVTNSVRSWDFPTPRSGEPSTINYPFSIRGN